MENEIFGELIQYGALGVMLILLSGYIIWLTNQHRSERGHWKKEFTSQANENRKLLDLQQDQLLEVINNTNGAIGSLKDILIKIDAKMN